MYSTLHPHLGEIPVQYACMQELEYRYPLPITHPLTGVPDAGREREGQPLQMTGR